ncbi:glycoside hydrolase family 99-like domain-containing protein [Lacticaseibacillus paracasei]|jgi:lipopolysaccharide biosynthesis protein|uniref:glycosyltransferase WbsX family protein n=1 Tax=Lacticaseibacillus paracasei TaxID=1597 RepID=UPI00097646DD|nr:glycoside hydrolase family 99-like domain-containing protein [Lacticaseibacillus paracasei]MCB5816392.1 glycoside hydrolase family 99-like domain-containing protein [Lacticaseibacillus paracasei]RND96664.1 hypothetical protein FAM19353_00758 [Lacticaseibacillus paracasei]RNE13088.1 hypothetical protein FAM3228_00790 [Lacticaseibacillus paracasei]
MKIIAFYLPQFHSFPENDAWWGKGFTEWTNTRKTVPQYKGHYEPREPLHDNYYNLLNNDVFRWQIDLAHKYGVYGFCFYHYWFGENHKLMQQPLENFLKDKTLDQKFCISWANETWSRRWNGSDKDVLIEQDYGSKETWQRHFEYLLPFFKDSRYINVDGKPLFILYKPEIFPEYRNMFKMWDRLAKENGLSGLTFAIQGAEWNTSEGGTSQFGDYRIMYEPGYTGTQKRISKGLRFGATSLYFKLKSKLNRRSNVQFRSYDAYCKNIIRRRVHSKNIFPGLFVNWDNTPRRGSEGSSFIGSSPKKFETYLSQLIQKARNQYNSEYIFVNAWNEWAEGCYLEPDKKFGYGYLEAIRNALRQNDEFPD